MSKKRRGRYNLLNALDLLEATLSKGYPDDGSGVAQDDDMPPGNIVYGEKYKKSPYFNKLTNYQNHWTVDNDDWYWDEFEHSKGMDDFDNYSDTLNSMGDLFDDERWKKVWSRMKNVPDDIVNKRFKKKGQPYRKAGDDQIGSEVKPYVEVDVDKGGSFKDADLKKGKKLLKNLENMVI